MKGLFVTGTDTGVGKTLVAGAIIRALAGHGVRAAPFKPVAAGCEQTPEGPRNADAVDLLAASVLPLDYEAVNPVALDPAIAPHIAAAEVRRRIDVGALCAAAGRLASGAHCVVVEGAGGWYVPLGPSATMADLAAELGLPVVLVVGMRLGCLNHALLAAEAIPRSGLTLGGWIANQVDPDMARVEENIAALDARIEAPRLGVVPCITSGSPVEKMDKASVGLRVGKLLQLFR